VIDIAQAHILALLKLDEFNGRAYNLGNGDGYTVLDVVEAARKVSGIHIPMILSPRRAGDPAVLVASSDRAKAELEWKPKYPEIEVILQHAWDWIQKNPDAYGS